MRHFVLATLLISATLAEAACREQEFGVLPEEEQRAPLPADAELAARQPTIPFDLFQDDTGDRGVAETRVIFTSATAYHDYFGHEATGLVDWSTDWVIFYSAGTQRSGGYEVSIKSITQSESSRTLHVATQLVSPGEGCAVTQGLTKPHVFAKFRQPGRRPEHVRFFRGHESRDCVPAAPAGPFCGGIAGIVCPGAGICVDDPRDDCDPRRGGADCGGICRCDALGLCVEGFQWDSSPEVCGCVARTADLCTGVRCPGGSRCVTLDGSAACVSDGALACGRSICPRGMVCCNASCGICTPPTGACIQIACE